LVSTMAEIVLDSGYSFTHVSFDIPTTFNDIPVWLNGQPGRTESWSVAYVSNTSIRLIADTGRYLRAIAATSTNFTTNDSLTSAHVYLLNIDSILLGSDTVFEVVPHNDTSFYLQAQLDNVLGMSNTSITVKSQSNFVPYCALNGSNWQSLSILPITATNVSSSLSYTTPVLSSGVNAPYSYNSVVRIIDANNGLTYQWSGLHTDTPSSAESNQSLTIGGPTYSYIDSFRVTIVGDASAGNITFTTLDGWVLHNYGQDGPHLVAPNSGVNATVYTIQSIVAVNGVQCWFLWDGGIGGFYAVSFQIVSPADATRYTSDLADDLAGWSTPPSNAAVQALAQQPEYQTAYHQLSNFNEHSSVLMNVQTQSCLSPPQYGQSIVNNRSSSAIDNPAFQWPFLTFNLLSDSNLTIFNFSDRLDGYVLSLDVNRRSRVAGQTGANDVFALFGQHGTAAYPWYVSVVDNGTDYNGTAFNWITVTFQHSWWLGWYLGVCADCEWGQTDGYGGPVMATVMMQSNESDPRVQWMMFQTD